MKLSFLIVFVVIVMFALAGQSEARWKGFKKIVSTTHLLNWRNFNYLLNFQKNAGKKVFNTAKKVLPIVANCKGIGK